MWMRRLGRSDIEVSAIGLGTVKLGRDQGVKYPVAFSLPDDSEARALIHQAQDLGVNLIDTAPAYGTSEERLGSMLQGRRKNWIICTKVGEEFDGSVSHYNFSGEHTRRSLERSLKRLRTDYLDVVLIHSDGRDEFILDENDALSELIKAREEGLIRAVGMSTKTVSGGIRAAQLTDVLMITYNRGHTLEEPVLNQCVASGTGVLLKKVFASGHLAESEKNRDPARAALTFALGHPATSSAIIGTINSTHLAANIAAAREVCQTA